MPILIVGAVSASVGVEAVMRHIVIVQAEPGMVLAAPAAGPAGETLLAAGHVLNEADIAMLHDAGADGIDVRDALAAYDRERPLFAQHVEAAALQALNSLIMMQSSLDAPVRHDGVQKLFHALDELVDGLFPDLDGQVDFSGPDSLQGHDYIHPIRVAELAVAIGRMLGLPKSKLVSLAQACALMNIGYSALRRSLLDEPRGLEEHEWRHHVEMHPEYSVNMLGEAGLSEEAVTAIAQHHERWDGSGYPNALKAVQIGMFARVMGVADTYVSLRSRRAYRNALSHKEAMQLLEEGSDEFFDPQVVRACGELMLKLVPANESAAAAAAARARSADDDAEASRRSSNRSADDTADPAARSKRTDAPADDPPAAAPAARSRPGAMRAPVAAAAPPRVAVRAARPKLAPVVVRNPLLPAPAAAAAVSRRNQRQRHRATLWSAAYYLETVRPNSIPAR